MQDALPIVIVAGVVAIVTLLFNSGAYDHIGRGAMTFDREAPSPQAAASDPFRDDEIRQMLEARNARRAAQGREPLDVEAELAALTRPAPAPVEDDLRAEVRAFVESRNARRIARGQPALDVESEVERRLSGQDG